MFKPKVEAQTSCSTSPRLLQPRSLCQCCSKFPGGSWCHAFCLVTPGHLGPGSCPQKLLCSRVDLGGLPNPLQSMESFAPPRLHGLGSPPGSIGIVNSMVPDHLCLLQVDAHLLQLQLHSFGQLWAGSNNGGLDADPLAWICWTKAWAHPTILACTKRAGPWHLWDKSSTQLLISAVLLSLCRSSNI